MRKACNFQLIWVSIALAAGCRSGVDLTLPPEPDDTLTVEALVPASGYAGDLVRVQGKGFPRDPAAIEVLFNGYGARPEVVDDEGLAVRVPAGIQSGQVKVSAAGRSGLSKDPFTYLGAGRLQRSTAVRSHVLEAGLGGLVRRGDDVFVLAQNSHQIVRVTGTPVRRRLDAGERPVDLAANLEVGGRLVYVTADALVAVPLGPEDVPMPALARRHELHPAEPLERVAVHPSGLAAIAQSAHAIHVVGFGPGAGDPETIALAPATTAGITLDDEGTIYGAANLAGAGLVAVTEPISRETSKYPYLRSFSGALLPFERGGRRWLAAGVEGGLALLDVAAGRFAESEVDLFTRGAPGGLVEVSGRIFATLPETGRLAAIEAPESGAPRVAWTLDLGGDPTQIVGGPEGLLYVTNPSRNLVQVVDPTTRSLLGEKRLGLGAGSALGGPNGVALASGDGSSANLLLLVLAREADSLLGLDPATLAPRAVALLGDRATAFAAAPGGRVLVAHENGRIGVVTLATDRGVLVEAPLCAGPLAECPKIEGDLLALEAFDDPSTSPATPRLLVATTRSIELRSLPDLKLVAAREAPSGTRFIDAAPTGDGVAALLGDGAQPAQKLTFAWWREDLALAGTGAPVDELGDAQKTLSPLGVAALRRVDRPGRPSPAYLFARVRSDVARPWLYAPERTSQALIPSPALGFAPLFSPDGRQAIATKDDALAVAQGELLSNDGMTPTAVIDLGAAPTGYAYAPAGDRAYVALGDSDTVVVLE